MYHGLKSQIVLQSLRKIVVLSASTGSYMLVMRTQAFSHLLVDYFGIYLHNAKSMFVFSFPFGVLLIDFPPEAAHAHLHSSHLSILPT